MTLPLLHCPDCHREVCAHVASALEEARRALEDVQAILAEPGTPPKSVWRAWQARHPAALGRPAPDPLASSRLEDHAAPVSDAARPTVEGDA